MVTKFNINNEWCATAILLSCLPCRHLGSVGRYHWIHGNIHGNFKKHMILTTWLCHVIYLRVWWFSGLVVHSLLRSILLMSFNKSFINLFSWYFIIEFVFNPWINEIGSVWSVRKFQNLMFQKVQSVPYLCIKLSIIEDMWNEPL